MRATAREDEHNGRIEMSKRMDGKVVVITGAGSGIGRQTSMRCAEQGAAVTCADINDKGARETADAITKMGGKAIAVKIDVTSPTDSAAMAKSTLDAFGRIDAVFANAGVTGEGTVENTPLDAWNKVIAINLTGVYLTCQAVLPAMIKQGNGAIVATASVAGISGVPSTASYSAAKAGVVGLVRQMAADFSQYNIRANAICPGTVPTPLVVSAYEQRGFIKDNDVDGAFRAASERFPLNRVGKIDDPALLTLFLLSDESSWLTGQAIAIDGGLTQVAWKPGR
jgi:NAD(P)-dependent dehydrogenase (short-subunit alcohol dehydrogenase family)